MPVIVALLVRSIIQMAITLGVISFAQKYLLPLIDFALVEVMTKFGVDEEKAKDIVSNELLKYAESIGIGVILLRAKLPTVIAEKLGFTSKGFGARNIVGVKTITTAAETGGASAVAEKIATVTAKTAGLSFDKIASVIKLGATIVGVPTGVLYMTAQFIDYGSWSGSAYQNTFQKIFSFFGLDPDKDARSPRTISKEIFDKIYTALKNEGAVGINDPYKNQTVLFNRDRLLDLADKLSSHILLEAGKVTTAQLLGAILPLVTIKKADGATIIGGNATASTTKAPIVPVKVFTGIVSQGTLGAAMDFTPRENDLIESVDELKDSAQNNLAPFIQALPGKIIYEIKIVSSVTTRDGFRRTGEAQKVLSKYTAAGVPLYRTIINKFAVLNIFIMTDKLSKSKISSIVLGPTDAVKLQPKTNELKNIEASIKQDLFTSNVADITGIQTAQPITITAPPVQPEATIIAPAPVAIIKPTIKQRDYFVEFDSFFTKVFYIDNGQLIASPDFASILDNQEKLTYGNYGGQTGEAIRRLKEKGYPVDSYPHKKFHHEINARYVDEVSTKTFEKFFDVSAMPTPTTPITKPASSTCLLSTLYDWYTAQRQSLPSIGQRATLYEQLGLCLTAYYVGTAEQNAKLLQSLKRNNGCNI